MHEFHGIPLRAGLIGGQGDLQGRAAILAADRERPAFQYRLPEPVHHPNSAVQQGMYLPDLEPLIPRYPFDLQRSVDAQRVTPQHYLAGGAVDKVSRVADHAVALDAGTSLDGADSAAVVAHGDEGQIL